MKKRKNLAGMPAVSMKTDWTESTGSTGRRKATKPEVRKSESSDFTQIENQPTKRISY